MDGKSWFRAAVVGLSCGAVGVALALGGECFGGSVPLADFCVLPAVVVALFFGARVGILTGAVTAFGLAACSLLGAGAFPVLAGGVLAATAVAVVARCRMFYGERPSLMPAALTAIIAVVAAQFVLLGFGGDDLASAAGTWLGGLPLRCGIAAAVTALLSIVFRARQAELPNMIATASLLVLFAAVYGVWFFNGRSAAEAAYKMAESFETDAIVSVDYPIEPELLHEAQRMVDRWGSVARMAQADLAAVASDLGYELVAAVGTNGVIAAANVPRTVGFRLADSEMLGELDALNRGRRYGSVEFHHPDAPMDVAGRHWVKFVGIAFPGGGFAMIGRSYADIDKLEYLFESSMYDWHIGKTGFMLIVDRRNDRIVSGFDKADTGKSLSESGISKLVPAGVGDLLEGEVFGIRSLVHPVALELVERYDGCIVMPLVDVMGTRDMVTLVVLAICLFLFSAGALILAKIIKQGRDITELRHREDEKRRKDMDLAKSIQASSLVREFPEGVYAFMRPAREVGGDFYDCFECSPGKLMLVIADVSGKGVPASLFMMRARTEFRAVSNEAHDVAAVMAEVNHRLCQNNIAEMFVTAWIGLLDQKTGEVQWSSAGHNPPYIVRADGSVEQLKGRRSLVLAGMDGVKYATNVLTLNRGDMLFLYTDGVTEAQSRTGAFFGERSLEQVLRSSTGDVTSDCNRIFEAVDAFAVGAPQADDITVLVHRRP